MIFITSIKPVSVNEKTIAIKKKTRFGVKAFNINSKKYTEVKKALKMDFARQAKEKKSKPYDCEVSVTIYDGWISYDIDNILKQVLDSLTGIAYTDDKNIGDLRREFFRDGNTGERIRKNLLMIRVEKFIWEKEDEPIREGK